MEQIKKDKLTISPPEIPPLREWAELFAQADTSPESEFDDWDITLQDGLEDT